MADVAEIGISQHQLPPLRSGRASRLSSAYMCRLRPSCFSLFMQVTRIALSFAFASAGNSIAARMAMMAITTNNSISVKAPAEREFERPVTEVRFAFFIFRDGFV